MKISDFLCDWLMKTDLFEQAYRKRELENKISSQQENIAGHMIKIMIFPESLYQDHWKTEVNGWLRPMNRYYLKGGDHLSAEEIFELLFDEPLGTTEEIIMWVNDMQEEYCAEVVEYDIVGLQKTLKSIMNTVSTHISERRFTKIEDYL